MSGSSRFDYLRWAKRREQLARFGYLRWGKVRWVGLDDFGLADRAGG